MAGDYFELKAREVKPAMWIIAVFSILFLSAGNLGNLMKLIQ